MIEEQLRSLKRSFRQYMNGAAAASMREKGLCYSVNWGISLPNLREIAAAYVPNRELSSALWNEHSRECRILATMIMPKEAFSRDMAEQWISVVDTPEIAEQLVFNLLQYEPYALDVALKMINCGSDYAILCAIHTLSRLLVTHRISSDEVSQEVQTKLSVLESSQNRTLAHAAYNCNSRLME